MGYIFIDGGPISWQAKSQSVVAHSTFEAEYIAASDATRGAIWLRRMRKDMSPPDAAPIRMGCDNQGALKFDTGTFKAKTKHIDAKYRHIHGEQKNHKTVDFHYVNTELNLADLLTKSLTRIRHESLVKRTGLCSGDKVDGMQEE